MIIVDEKVVWQPQGIYSKGEFSVIVDRKFVEKASKLKINFDIKNKMKDLAENLMQSKLTQPFLFEGDSYMVSQFTYDAGRGVWLAFGSLGKNALNVFEGNIKYNSHNADHGHQQRGLMSLVDIWATYYNIVKSSLK
jgi:hypothetical protein